MKLRGVRRSEPVTTDLEALFARVRPKTVKPAESTVADLVRAEFDRRRRADEEAQRRADEDRFRGGPCVHCGVELSIEMDENGVKSPAWHAHPRGSEDTWCSDWRAAGGDDELLDKVAAIIRDEGFEALSNPYRLSFHIERGLAAELGVVAWIDSGMPPGAPWAHLRHVETALRACQEDDEAQRTGLPWRTFGEFLDATAHLPGFEPGPGYGSVPDPVASRFVNVRLEFAEGDTAKLRSASKAEKERIYKQAADRARGERRR